MATPKTTTGKRQTTLKDIAEHVGVSINTVSGVLNPRSIEVRVSDNTRRAILEAARRFNYRRNVAASRLAGGQTRTVGILMESLTHALSAPIADGFEQEMVRQGYQCFVGCTRYDGLQKMQYIQRFLEHGVNGLLLTTAWNDPEVKQALSIMLDAEMPVVFVDYVWGEHPGPLVCGNHFRGGQLLAAHLLEMGHRSFAFMANQETMAIESAKDRLKGVRSVLQEAGLDPAHLRVFLPDYTGPYADRFHREQMVDSLRRHMGTPDAPSVVICANDVTAYGLIVGLWEQGLRVPNDLAVTGYDDLNSCFMNSLGFAPNTPVPWAVPLTTIHQPFTEIGRQAARVMIQMVEGVQIPKNECFYQEVSLVARESSGLPDWYRPGAAPPPPPAEPRPH